MKTYKDEYSCICSAYQMLCLLLVRFCVFLLRLFVLGKKKTHNRQALCDCESFFMMKSDFFIRSERLRLPSRWLFSEQYSLHTSPL